MGEPLEKVKHIYLGDAVVLSLDLETLSRCYSARLFGMYHACADDIYNKHIVTIFQVYRV